MWVVQEMRDGPSDIVEHKQVFTNDSLLKVHSAVTGMETRFSEQCMSVGTDSEALFCKHCKNCGGEVTCPILNRA